MRAKDLKELMDKLNTQREHLMMNKGQDYAGEEDILSNIDRIGEALELLRVDELPGPLMYEFTMVLRKLDKWINLILQGGGTPKGESVVEVVCDFHNHVDLALAMSHDLEDRACAIPPDADVEVLTPITTVIDKGTDTVLVGDHVDVYDLEGNIIRKGVNYEQRNNGQQTA